jgi:hypothetical protein
LKRIYFSKKKEKKENPGEATPILKDERLQQGGPEQVSDGRWCQQ